MRTSLGRVAAPVLAVEHCPVCGATDGGPAPLGLRRCTGCGAVHATRRADPDAVYTEGYYTAGGEFGLDVMHPRFQRFLALAARRRVARITRLAARPGTWLDVGCGTGELLAGARDAGWRVVGVEPTEDSARIAAGRGLDVRVAMLADSGVEPGAWDVVTAYHVLEHVPDVVGLVRDLGRWARPGGLVVAESPNWDARLRDATGEGWPDLRPLEHVTHFTPQTLPAAMRAAGLEPVAVGTDSYPSPEHTLDEACESAGRPGLAHRLRPLCRERDAGGVRAIAPGPALRRAIRALAAADERRGRGRTVWAAARA